jgi:cell division protein FtsW
LLGLRVAALAGDRFSQLAAVGISTWLATETIVNVGAVTGVLPVTGIPLPFISFGGTSLVIDMAAVGVLVGIARRAATRPALRVVAPPRAVPATQRPKGARRAPSARDAPRAPVRAGRSGEGGSARRATRRAPQRAPSRAPRRAPRPDGRRR